MTAEHIIKEFPNLVVKDLQGGANVYLPNEVTLTFWFKKRKWKSNKKKDWRQFADTQDALKVISGLGEIEIKKPLKTPEIALVNTTQLCIDHIKRKIEMIERIKPNNGVIMILKQLTLEMEQYL
jgi:hypothetical protein